MARKSPKERHESEQTCPALATDLVRAQARLQILGRIHRARDAFETFASHIVDDGVDGLLRKAKRLGRLANRHAPPETNDRADHGGAMAAVTAIDFLEHFFATFVLEVDVDVGRFGSLHRKKAFEEKVHLHGVDGRDAEHVADGGVRRRSAALEKDVLIAGVLEDVPDGEEVVFVAELGDELELVIDLFPERGLLFGGELQELLVGELPEPARSGLARGDGFLGVTVTQFLEREMKALLELEPAFEGVDGEGRTARSLQPRGQDEFEAPQIIGAQEPSFGIGLRQVPKLVEGLCVSDRGHELAQLEVLAIDEERKGRGEKRQPEIAGPLHEPFLEFGHAGRESQRKRERERGFSAAPADLGELEQPEGALIALLRGRREAGRRSDGVLRADARFLLEIGVRDPRKKTSADGNENEVPAQVRALTQESQEVAPPQRRQPLLAQGHAFESPARKEAAKIGVGAPMTRIDEERIRDVKVEADADGERKIRSPLAGLARGVKAPREAVESHAVGEPEARVTAIDAGVDELVRLGRALEKRKTRSSQPLKEHAYNCMALSMPLSKPKPCRHGNPFHRDG